MSSSGIEAINSGPLILRTYNNSSPNKSIVLENYDNPVSSNYVLITSTGGLLAPSDNIYISSVSVSTIFAVSSFSVYQSASTFDASTAQITQLYVCTLSSNVGWIKELEISSINGYPYDPQDSLWTALPGTPFGSIHNTNVGNVGINTSTPMAKLTVNGTFSTTGTNVLGNDTLIQGSTQITNYLSTNVIEMNNGYIRSLGGLIIDRLNISSQVSDGDASLSLFNGNTILSTNTFYDGCYLELSSSGPNFLVTGFNKTPTYAAFTSTYNTLNNTLDVVAPSFINQYEHFLTIDNQNPGSAVSGQGSILSRLNLRTAQGQYSLILTHSKDPVDPDGFVNSTLQLYSSDFLGHGINRRILDINPRASTIFYGNLQISSNCSILVESNVTAQNYISTPLIYMSTIGNGPGTGKIEGLSTINGVEYPPPVSGEIPVGGIIMWSGTSVTLPTNFNLCDGGIYNDPPNQVQTPDLRGRFIMGATYANGTNRYTGSAATANTFDSQPTPPGPQQCPALAVGTAGGEISNTLTVNQIPPHNHDYSFTGSPFQQYLFNVPFAATALTTFNPINSTSLNTGGGQRHNNMPQYYVLAYIMRTK